MTTITRHTDSRYEVVIPDANRSDIDMELVGSVLRMGNSISGIRTNSFHVNLGPKSLALVAALPVGQSVTIV